MCHDGRAGKRQVQLLSLSFWKAVQALPAPSGAVPETGQVAECADGQNAVVMLFTFCNRKQAQGAYLGVSARTLGTIDITLICSYCLYAIDYNLLMCMYGGERGIRTPDTLSSMPVFKTGAINHSASSPLGVVLVLIVLRNRSLPAGPVGKGRQDEPGGQRSEGVLLVAGILSRKRGREALKLLKSRRISRAGCYNI